MLLQLICKSQFAKTQEYMSPFLTCFPLLPTAEPYGQGHTHRAHIKRRRLIMPLVALVQKNRAHQRLRTFVWCLGFASSSPLLLAFRLRRSECLYRNAFSRHPSKYRVFGRVQEKTKGKHMQIKQNKTHLSRCAF